jgi:Carboxypeptidase regulatory-like domain
MDVSYRARVEVLVCVVAFLVCSFSFAVHAQQTLGSINGTVTDASGAVIQGVRIQIRNVGTNLVVNAQTKGDGSFSTVDLPIGTYEVTFTKEGFQKDVYSQILVKGNATTTVNAKMSPGTISSTVIVSATPLLNQTDTSNGYTLGSEVIQQAPLGTGSFTQLAILAPGVSADFLSGSGSNEGLGNQGIVANGQRDTSNSFTFNSVNANNLFNGNSTSNISDSRFTLNTGEVFGTGGQVQTNTSVYDAIGEGLPTPPKETIEELQVTTSMYDASQGSKSGAHVELTTKSGTNDFHGQAYEYFQNNAFDATPTFLTPNTFFSGAPPLHRNVFGATAGGPVKKDKLFFFTSYQGQRVSDALNGAFAGVPTLHGLTDQNRDANNLANLVNTNDNCGVGRNPACITAGEVDPAALALLQAKTHGGQFIIPSETLGTNIPAAESGTQRFNSAIVGPPSTFHADQVNGNVDYLFSSKDRLAAKYYYQRDPSTSPFAVSQVLGFPQSLRAGSQVFSLENTTILTPNSTWEQRFGYIRQIADATTGQDLAPGDIGLTLPSGALFPGVDVYNADAGAPSGSSVVAPLKGNELRIGPSTNFANAGVFQNEFEWATKYNWVVGRHTFAFGGTYDYSQLNVENRENQVAILSFNDFADFLTGTLGADHSDGTLLDGETNRHFRSKEASLYAQDDVKLKPNLTLDAGLRWDWDGPLYETNGLMTNFYPSYYGYNLPSDSFAAVSGTPGIGLVVAGNNKTLGTRGVSSSTLTGRQWGFAPRLGIAWSPSFVKNLVIRAGAGLYYDRGEYFTELSTSAGLGISGPFSVTTQEPFTIPLGTSCTASLNCLSNAPFGTTLPAPPSDLSGVAGLFPDLRDMAGCFNQAVPGQEQPGQPYCAPNSYDPPRSFLFGGYNPANKLPYSENWSLDVQWQPTNTIVLTMGYLGNHGVHEPLPIPFNQPGVATPSNPINNQIYSYGYLAATPTTSGGCDFYNDGSPTCVQLPPEAVQTTVGEYAASDGNVNLRTPYVGLNPNADSWTANGVSTYNALQLGLIKRFSHGLQVNASYTYSHSLDEGSGLGAGLFFNGNDPLNPRTSYASSDFDRPHVFTISYYYQLPKIKNASGFVSAIANGWGVTGVTVAQSGEPFSVIDFSGSAASIFYSADDYITNPILPLASGVSPSQATVGGTDLIGTSGTYQGYRIPYVDPNAFAIPYLNPGDSGVPPCQTVGATQVCDTQETGYGGNGRNIFRASFQTRFDFSVFKDFKLTERFSLKFEADAFNLFNHPNFDTPNTDFELNGCFNPVPCYDTVPFPPNSRGWGVIDGTIGSPRFLQLQMHLTF